MPSLFQSLLVVIANSTHKELARQIHYLKVENEILRGKLPARITVTPAERRRLLRAGAKLGKMLRHLVTIVRPDTFLRWLRADRKRSANPSRRPGRRRTDEQVRRLVLKLARENPWGYTRILGELNKLGIRRLSKNTVKRILREHGFDPKASRGHSTWDEFLKRHAVSLWQCDFLSRRVVTVAGIRDAFVLVFIHVKTRQVVLSPATLNPNQEWVAEQTHSFVSEARGRGLRVGMIQHDRDRKFCQRFRECLRRYRVKRIRTQFRAPNLNAYVERFIQSIQQECLEHFVVLGPRHLDHLCREYLEH